MQRFRCSIWKRVFVYGWIPGVPCKAILSKIFSRRSSVQALDFLIDLWFLIRSTAPMAPSTSKRLSLFGMWLVHGLCQARNWAFVYFLGVGDRPSHVFYILSGKERDIHTEKPRGNQETLWSRKLVTTETTCLQSFKVRKCPSQDPEDHT